MMAGYAVACKYGVYESRAFALAEDIYRAMASVHLAAPRSSRALRAASEETPCPVAGAAPTEQEPPLEKLLRYCDDSDGSCYGSLATDLVRKLVIDALASPARPAAVQREFVQHTPDADGWSEWVCPAPDSYLMKCCDCGLVHELQFRVAQYAAPRPSEEFDICADPQLQAQFRAQCAEGALASAAAQPTSAAPAETPEQEQERAAIEAKPRLVNGQWEGVPLANFPHMREAVRRGLEDGSLSIGCEAPAAPPEGMTLRQRCDTALQCLPEAPYRAQLARLFEDLLAAPAAAGMPQPVATWRCFHCDEVFTEEAAAREHFGSSERQQPACAIDIAEYRRMEEAHRRQCEDDTDWHRAFYKLGCDHTQAMRQHGDAEYARGLRDGVNLPADSPERAALFAPPTPASEVAQDAAR
jgi:hypothetical protein